jgi:hypothetical protein
VSPYATEASRSAALPPWYTTGAGVLLEEHEERIYFANQEVAKLYSRAGSRVFYTLTLLIVLCYAAWWYAALAVVPPPPPPAAASVGPWGQLGPPQANNSDDDDGDSLSMAFVAYVFFSILYYGFTIHMYYQLYSEVGSCMCSG